MILRKHLKYPTSGILLLESPPQYRSIIYNEQPKRIAFPYLLFKIRYNYFKPKYCFPGFGLQIFSANEPITSMESEVGCSPTEYYCRGYSPICTNHDYDDSEYPNLKNLTNEIISVWQGLEHDGMPDFLIKTPLEQIKTPNYMKPLKIPNFDKNYSLQYILNMTREYLGPFNYGFSLDKKLLLKSSIGIDKFANLDWNVYSRNLKKLAH